MKKIYGYLFLILTFLLFTILIFRYRTPDVTVELKMRGGELASTAEWANTKAAINKLIENVRLNPNDEKSKTELAFAYIQEGRVSGNHAYYDKAALFLFDEILSKNEGDYQALIGKATVLLSQHHFSDALPLAMKAKSINPYSSAVYGIITDGYVETGEYEKAIQMADSMVALRPDLRSYSRISYLREILGDYNGAIEAMKMAVEAGYPGSEQAEWTRVQLGKLYENTGDLLHAELCYNQSIYFRPSFAWGYEGKARIEKIKRNYPEAISYCKQAQALLNDFSFQQELTEIYRITNQQELAAASARKTIELLGGSKGDESEVNHGHYADKELAYAYLDAYDYTTAFKHAITEYNRRPENIEVNEALAWVCYKLGNYEKANEHIDKAMRTHSKNPVLSYRAGMIKKKAGYFAESKKLIELAYKVNPFVSPLITLEAEQVLVMN